MILGLSFFYQWLDLKHHHHGISFCLFLWAVVFLAKIKHHHYVQCNLFLPHQALQHISVNFNQSLDYKWNWIQVSGRSYITLNPNISLDKIWSKVHYTLEQIFNPFSEHISWYQIGMSSNISCYERCVYKHLFCQNLCFLIQFSHIRIFTQCLLHQKRFLPVLCHYIISPYWHVMWSLYV